jgi:hypothetical protein
MIRSREAEENFRRLESHLERNVFRPQEYSASYEPGLSDDSEERDEDAEEQENEH